MTDIVERLRQQAWQRSGAPKMDAGHTKMVEWQAADEIERLRAAAKLCHHEMRHTVAPRDSFTDALDALDAALYARS